MTRRDPASLTCFGFLFAALFWALVQPWWISGGTARRQRLAARAPGPLRAPRLAAHALRRRRRHDGHVPARRRRPAHISATRVAIVAMLEPVAASAVAFLWLGESFGAAQLAGGAIVLAGILLAQTARFARSASLFDHSIGESSRSRRTPIDKVIMRRASAIRVIPAVLLLAFARAAAGAATPEPERALPARRGQRGAGGARSSSASRSTRLSSRAARPLHVADPGRRVHARRLRGAARPPRRPGTGVRREPRLGHRFARERAEHGAFVARQPRSPGQLLGRPGCGSGSVSRRPLPRYDGATVATADFAGS